MKEFEELIEIKAQKERLMERISNIQAPYLEKAKEIQNEMELSIAEDATLLSDIQDRDKEIREFLLEEWPEDVEKQYKDDHTGLKITRKTRQTPEVHDLKAMLAQAVTFDELPVKKVTWNNTALKALISAGVVKPEVATLKDKFELAITFPKEE